MSSHDIGRLGKRRLRALKARSKALSLIRAYFGEEGFLEVETPLLVPAPGLEVHLKSFRSGDKYLITSPEYQMKRLLVSGLEKIYTICKCFRDEESGPQHNTEFTMIEWYRAHETLDAILDDTEALVHRVLSHFWPDEKLQIGQLSVSFKRPWKRVTLRQLMKEHARVDVVGDETTQELKAKMSKMGHTFGTAEEWDDVFFTVFLNEVEPKLREMDEAVFVTEWPLMLGALAKRSSHGGATVERFEAYLGGIELANAFGELTCPKEQRQRFENDLSYRRRNGLHVPPLDEKFLSALAEGMPDSSGIALGVDRLVMLATGCEDIQDVLSFSDREV